MENINHNSRMTSAELANLWSQYMNDSLSRCKFRYFIKNVQDHDIKGLE